jgi:hypothetical protein
VDALCRVITATSCGAAVSRREQVIVSDVSTDRLCEEFRALALVAAIGAVWSLPFYAKDRREEGLRRAPLLPEDRS